MPNKPYLLNSRETFERYERRSPVLNHSQYPEASFVVEPPTLVQSPNQFVVTEYPNFEEKRKSEFWVVVKKLLVGDVFKKKFWMVFWRAYFKLSEKFFNKKRKRK